MLELDALDKLDLFEQVFDVKNYMLNRHRYLEQFYIDSIRGDRFMKELVPYFENELTWTFKLKAIVNKVIQVLRNRLKF